MKLTIIGIFGYDHPEYLNPVIKIAINNTTTYAELFQELRDFLNSYDSYCEEEDGLDYSEDYLKAVDDLEKYVSDVLSSNASLYNVENKCLETIINPTLKGDDNYMCVKVTI